MINGVNEEDCVKEVYAGPFDRTGKTQISDERRAHISDDSLQCEKFRTIAENLSDFYEEYLRKNSK